MSTHIDVKSLRNVCFKISKLGSNTEQYAFLRQKTLETPGDLGRFIPEFIVKCENPAAVRSYLSNLVPNDEQGSVYKRRRRFLEQAFAELIYWSERTALLPSEIDALQMVDCADRATMDHVIQQIRACVETEPRRSVVLSKHAVLDSASYLLEDNGVRPDVKADLQYLFEQVIQIAEHPTADQEINFFPDGPFMAAVMPIVKYIDQQSRYYSWEEGNRKPEYPTVTNARHFGQAATLLCEILWQWTLDDSYPLDLH